MNIINMYITMMPVILAGIANMIFVKTKFYNKYKYPIDCNKNFVDGKRIFGNNKTILGFTSMIFFSIIIQLIWGVICQKFLYGRNYIYTQYENTIKINILIGFLLGLFYMLFELPNSFIKRRLDIKPGKTKKGGLGNLFLVIDQIDSIIGVTLVIAFFTKINLFQFFMYIILGGLTHITINFILYKLKIRRNL